MHIDYEPFKTDKPVAFISFFIFTGIILCFWIYCVLTIGFEDSVFLIYFMFIGIMFTIVFRPRKFLVRFDDKGILIERGKRKKMMPWESIYSVASVKDMTGLPYWLIAFRKLSKVEKWKIVNIYGRSRNPHGGLTIARADEKKFQQQALEIDAFIREHAQRWEPLE